MTVHKGESFEKRVPFKAFDEERRVAIGGVLVPNKVDLQGDFVRPPVIEQFNDGFMTRLQSSDGEAVPGVMHAVFPDDHVTLSENRILDETQVIAGKEFRAGSWIQGWKFHDDELWRLVRDGVLSAYSIGAREVHWSEPMGQEELPDDIGVAADYPEDEPVWQILDGKVVEVSSVDLPAVPDAVMVAAKSGGLGKSILDQVGGKNEFVGVMQDRGASEDDAERLWHYLQRTLEETGGKTASNSFFRRLGKGAWETLTGDSEAKTSATDGAAKESRTLSEVNRHRLMAAHDALEDALESDVEFQPNRFTDNPAVDFDVADYDGKIAPTEKDAPGGETPDRTTQTMGDDPMADAPEWGKALYEQTEKNSERIDNLSEKVGDDDGKDAWEDAPPWAKELREEQKEVDERVEQLAEASGKSQQLEGGDGGNESSRSKADILGLPGGGD